MYPFGSCFSELGFWCLYQTVLTCMFIFLPQNISSVLIVRAVVRQGFSTVACIRFPWKAYCNIACRAYPCSFWSRRSWVRISISNKSPGDTATVGAGTTCWEPLIYARKSRVDMVHFSCQVYGRNNFCSDGPSSFKKLYLIFVSSQGEEREYSLLVVN